MISRLRILDRVISLILVISILLMSVGCSNSPPQATLSDPNPQIQTESIETEKIEIESVETETILHEFLTTEIYLQEFIIVEDKITELLLEEETIEDVAMCRTIYVPQENIAEFSTHSQTSKLFGEGVDMTSVLEKVAIGTGVIVTIAVIKKVGVPNHIASVIAAAADDSLKYAATGAAVGSVFGAFTGAANEIDDTGKAAAIAGFALATVGLIISMVSLASAVPSAGTTGFGVAEGVHLAFAGIKLLLAASGTIYARDAVTALTSTNASEIDWNNINWDKVGVSAAQKAINNGADGYMWGAIYGAIEGADEAYYDKYCTPYTQYQNRLKQVPKNGDKGHWSGKRGESDFILDDPISLPNGTTITKVTYQNAVPDFEPYEIARVKIKMTKDRYSNTKKGIVGNFDKADAELAKLWSKIKYNKQANWTIDDVVEFREKYPCKLVWHEMSNMETMQLVPYDVNDIFRHYGGVAEYKAMVGEKGE